MKKKIAFVLMTLTAGAATAQTPAPPPFIQGEPETIYSDAQRAIDLDHSRRVVETLLAPSFSVDDQYARWKRPVCPRVYGLTPVAAWQLEHHIKEVAHRIGAPVDRNDPCVPSIGIVFTPQPQASLMSIANANPYLVQGGNQTLSVRYPVEAWYATWRVDYDGFRNIDIPWEKITPPLEEPPHIAANDSRLHTGLTAEIATATVLVDTQAVTGMTLGELGDYLSMMTLAQAGQFGTCMPMATIANLMLKGCGEENTPHKLSHVDIAMLTALYSVPDVPELLQKQRIVGAMRRSLEAQYGKD